MPLNLSGLLRFRDNPVAARCVPFALFIALLMAVSFVTNLMPATGVPHAIFGVNWLVVSRAVIVALALAWFWSGYSELRNPPPINPIHWLIAVFAGFAVFLLWIWFDQDWAVLSRKTTGFNPSLPGGGMDWVQALMRLAGFSLVVPLMEELFWRSFLLRWLVRNDFLAVAPRLIGFNAFLITAVLFALEHDQWLAGLIAGMVYNALYIRSGNLWVPTVSHAVTNASLGIWILYTRNWYFW